MEASNLNMHESVGARPECWEEVKNRGRRWEEGTEMVGDGVGRGEKGWRSRAEKWSERWWVGGVDLETGGSVRVV